MSRVETKRKYQWMMAILIIHCTLLMGGAPLMAQTGSWRTYMAYYEPQQIMKIDNQLFVRASDGLYSYNLNDESITTYDKMKQLNDTHITMIAKNEETKKLMVVYQNQNIDVIDSNGEVDNISALYLKSMTGDKTINSVFMHGRFAYLATGFGVMKVNMKKVEVADSYILNFNVLAVGISGDNIYLKTSENKILTASLSSELKDTRNWTETTDAPAGIFDQDLTDWNEYHVLVSMLKPGGPKYNNFQFMLVKHNRLYTCGGGYNVGLRDLEHPGTVQILKDGEWLFTNEEGLTAVTGVPFVDTEIIEADNNNPDHYWAGGRTGLYEFNGVDLVNHYTIDNSPLRNSTSSKKYVLVTAMTTDNNNNLWVLNSMGSAPLQNLLELNTSQEWVSHYKDELVSSGLSLLDMRSLMQDSRGYLWFVNENYLLPSIYCYDPQSDRIIYAITTITNQDGLTYEDYAPTCLAEDLEGNIWIATTVGPFVIESNSIGSASPSIIQVKVPRNDGTDYADYLMATAHINTMVIDGAGRKWFGTLDNGIYLISADNMEEIEHFTIDNSPLLSNGVNSLAINNETGELFIGTDVGLCSYMTDATTAVNEISKDNVYAFPNPVVAGYEGLITVRGFALDSDVKILSTSGKLIAQGRSNGGTFTWDGRDQSGRRVASGVYMVAAATSDGKKGTVCKIAIIQ
ncbi:MAG: Por secretion system protein [Prevotella sp.]|nr:Por secretion system protein [Prevotella sp.]